jgi:hypothetical protein
MNHLKGFATFLSLYFLTLCFFTQVHQIKVKVEKLEIRAKQFLPGSEGVGREREGTGKAKGVGEGGRNDPNIVCT